MAGTSPAMTESTNTAASHPHLRSFAPGQGCSRSCRAALRNPCAPARKGRIISPVSCATGAGSSKGERMAPSRTQFGYRRHPDQDRGNGNAAEHPVVVVGAGPVGLSLAIDLAQRGLPVVLLDDADRIGEGSRAICFSKRSLEYWDRLGVGSRMVDKGVVWSVGKIFHGDSLLYQ